MILLFAEPVLRCDRGNGRSQSILADAVIAFGMMKVEAVPALGRIRGPRILSRDEQLLLGRLRLHGRILWLVWNVGRAPVNHDQELCGFWSLPERYCRLASTRDHVGNVQEGQLVIVKSFNAPDQSPPFPKA